VVAADEHAAGDANRRGGSWVRCPGTVTVRWYDSALRELRGVEVPAGASNPAISCNQLMRQSYATRENVMTKEDNLAVQQKFGSAVNSGQLELLRDVIASDVVDHDPAPDQGAGPEGYIRMFAALRTSFPDLEISGDQLVIDDDKIAIAYTMTGTQKGEFLGVAPTGRKIRARGVQIARFKDGKMVERWGSSDQLGILQQIGARSTSA
jgi:steroid delta-isomerase-like uncharacterized protein